MKASIWFDQGKNKKIKDIHLFYQVGGEGEPLLLLHAYPTASYGWHKLWPDLAASSFCLAPDMPGSGFSDKPTSYSYSILHLSDIIEHLLEELGITEYHIFAHAYGVSVAQELLSRHYSGHLNRTSHIKSVCFLSGGIFPELAHISFMQKFLLSPFGEIITQLFPAPYKAFKRNFSKTFGPNTQPSEEEMKEYWKILTYHDGHKRVPKVIRYLTERLIHRNRWVKAMQHTNVRLGFINAVEDPILGKPMSQRWEELLPQHFLYNLNMPLGHYPPLETPQEVLSAYLNFRNT